MDIDDDYDDEKLSTGAIVGIVFGVIALIIIAVSTTLVILMKKEKQEMEYYVLKWMDIHVLGIVLELIKKKYII